MKPANAIASIGKGVATESVSLVQESTKEAVNTMIWALTFGVLTLSNGGEKMATLPHRTKPKQVSNSTQETSTKDLAGLAHKDQVESQNAMKRYRAMIEEERQIAGGQDQEKRQWKRRVEDEMRAKEVSPEFEEAPAALSDVGSHKTNPNLFVRTSKEKGRKKGM